MPFIFFQDNIIIILCDKFIVYCCCCCCHLKCVALMHFVCNDIIYELRLDSHSTWDSTLKLIWGCARRFFSLAFCFVRFNVEYFVEMCCNLSCHATKLSVTMDECTLDSGRKDLFRDEVWYERCSATDNTALALNRTATLNRYKWDIFEIIISDVYYCE